MSTPSEQEVYRAYRRAEAQVGFVEGLREFRDRLRALAWPEGEEFSHGKAHALQLIVEGLLPEEEEAARLWVRVANAQQNERAAGAYSDVMNETEDHERAERAARLARIPFSQMDRELRGRTR